MDVQGGYGTNELSYRPDPSILPLKPSSQLSPQLHGQELKTKQNEKMKAEPRESMPVKEEIPARDVEPCPSCIQDDPYLIVPTQHLRMFGP